MAYLLTEYIHIYYCSSTTHSTDLWKGIRSVSGERELQNTYHAILYLELDCEKWQKKIAHFALGD